MYSTDVNVLNALVGNCMVEHVLYEAMTIQADAHEQKVTSKHAIQCLFNVFQLLNWTRNGQHCFAS